MENIDATREALGAAQLKQIRQIVAEEGILVLPTDTVYGIGADPYSTDAVNAVLAAKGRGRQMPPPVLVADVESAEKVSAHVSSVARKLMEAFWPGGLTLILPTAKDLHYDLGDIKDTVAVRMPDNPVALQILRAVGPLAVTSANLTGQSPATDVDAARAYFQDKVDLYVDGGPTPGGVPSTIVDVTGEPKIVRSGVLDDTEVRRYWA